MTKVILLTLGFALLKLVRLLLRRDDDLEIELAEELRLARQDIVAGEGEQAARRVSDVFRELEQGLAEPSPPLRFDAYLTRGIVSSGRDQWADAAEDLEDAKAIAEESQLPSELLRYTMEHLAGAYDRAGSLQRSEAVLRELSVQYARLGDEDLPRLQVEVDLGTNLFMQGRFADAEKTLTGVVDELRQLAPEHEMLGWALESLGGCSYGQGDPEQALQLHRRCLQHCQNHRGLKHSDAGRAHFNIAGCLRGLERFEEALGHAHQAQEVLNTLPEAHEWRARAEGLVRELEEKTSSTP